MVFTNNLTFLLICLFFLVYFTVFMRGNEKTERHRSKFIAIASVLFYATWYPPAIILLLFHTALGFYGGRALRDTSGRRTLFVVIFISLTPLLVFKYFNFFISVFGLDEFQLDLILPLGISFYTFSMVGFYIDIYRGRVKSNQSFVDILLFVAFWPHLAAGPILRAKNIFSNSFKSEKLTFDTFTLSIVLILTGLVKKLLIADNIGSYVNWNISYGVEGMTAIEAWVTMLGFSAQIYADFSGYSDMAIGFALLMGFRLPANFNYPYVASSMTDFWRRWHISLSIWFRDYLYFPLGGNQKGPVRMYFNIMIVFVLSGFWHGAGFGFLIWGAIHGFLLVIEKVFAEQYLAISVHLRRIATLFLVVVAWVFFRFEFTSAKVMINRMFVLSEQSIRAESPYHIVVIVLLLIFPIADHLIKFYHLDKRGYPTINRSGAAIATLGVLVLLALTFSGNPLPFIYFEF